MMIWAFTAKQVVISQSRCENVEVKCTAMHLEAGICADQLGKIKHCPGPQP